MQFLLVIMVQHKNVFIRVHTKLNLLLTSLVISKNNSIIIQYRDIVIIASPSWTDNVKEINLVDFTINYNLNKRRERESL